MDDRDGAPLRAQEVGTILDLLEPIAGTRLLEVGVGAGLHLSAAVARGAITWGVDPSADVLRAARRDAPDADLRLGEPSSLPFDSASFDIVCAFGHLIDSDGGNAIDSCPVVGDVALTELFRVCRPGGRLALAGAPLRRFRGTDGPSLERNGATVYQVQQHPGVAILVR